MAIAFCVPGRTICRRYAEGAGQLIRIPKAASLAFALALSGPAVFVLIYGSLGLNGFGAFTASYLGLTVVVMMVFGSFGDFRFSALDVPFLVLIVCAGISFAKNPVHAELRDLVLLMLTASAYLAGRSLGKDDLSVLRTASFWISAAIVCTGGILTIPYLVSESLHGALGRPFVLGFDSATTAFSSSLGICVIVLLSSGNNRPTWVRNASLAMIAISTAVFAASMVRFSLLAIMACAALCAVVSKRRRRLALGLFCILVASTVLGLIARSTNADLYLRYTLEETRADRSFSSAGILPPSHSASRNPGATTPKCEKVNTRNSVAIRKQLMSDALDLIPRAGLFGSGFMSFGELGCFEGMSPHNDLAQTIIEFGWIGGIAFCLLIILMPLSLAKAARTDDDMLFPFLLNAFMIMLSMIYGQIGRDLPLFLAFGLAVSVLSRNHASATAREYLKMPSRSDHGNSAANRNVESFL
ncbi:O-antigen ligase [Bradyrhizobium liaoningense]|uniref:O-antigen ligase family protein n=1 Tax=Bradyrhizobium liaoningense TaxID=43992 RepID=UPI001BAE4541|nr:O-antigen ligase family protein [Bradyrhizobium liaoningense]MBR1031234.1 O-antigen ligase family protein [Bradyrhizobium liaoningense]